MKNPIKLALIALLLTLAQAQAQVPCHFAMVGLDFGAGETLATLIPIVAIIAGCSIPIVIVSLTLYFRHEKTKLLHQTVRSMVEKGVPIPPELLSGHGADDNKDPFGTPHAPHDRRTRNDRRRGLILLGIGAGVVMLAGDVGWIILFLGVALIVASMFEKRERIDNAPPKI